MAPVPAPGTQPSYSTLIFCRAKGGQAKHTTISMQVHARGAVLTLTGLCFLSPAPTSMQCCSRRAVRPKRAAPSLQPSPTAWTHSPDPQSGSTAQTCSLDTHPRPADQTHRPDAQPRPVAWTHSLDLHIRPTAQTHSLDPQNSPDPQNRLSPDPQPGPTDQTHTPAPHSSMPSAQGCSAVTAPSAHSSSVPPSCPPAHITSASSLSPRSGLRDDGFRRAHSSLSSLILSLLKSPSFLPSFLPERCSKRRLHASLGGKQKDFYTASRSAGI